VLPADVLSAPLNRVDPGESSEEKFQMSQQAVQQSYRGVRCLSCRQPIPLPSFLIETDSRIRGLSAHQADEHSTRVFSLRCRACEREKPYRVTDIMDFEGEPRVHLRRAHPLQEHRTARARAANG